MKLPRIFLTVFLIVAFYSNAQSTLGVENFLALSITKISDLDYYLNKQKFELTNSVKKDSSITLTYTSRDVRKENIGLITTTRDLKSDSSLTYSFYNNEENFRLLDDLNKLKFKLLDSDNTNGELEKHYHKEDYTISIYKMFDNQVGDFMYMYSFSIKRDK